MLGSLLAFTVPPSVETAVMSTVVVVIVPWVVAVLHQLQAWIAAKATTAQQGSMAALYDNIFDFLLTHAEANASTVLPNLAQQILDGKITTQAQIQAQLHSIGDDLRQTAVTYFSNAQNVDLTASVGKSTLDALIDRAAAKVSPFPGARTSVELLKPNVSKAIIVKGIDYVRNNYLVANQSVVPIVRPQTA